MNPTPPPSRDGKHTALPWRRHDMEGDVIVGPNGQAIALVYGRSRSDEENDANLLFILRRINSYDRLRDALKAAFEFIDFATFEDRDGTREIAIQEGCDLHNCGGPVSREQLAEARAAIAATGGPDGRGGE